MLDFTNYMALTENIKHKIQPVAHMNNKHNDCVCVCLSLAAFPHYCMDPDVIGQMGAP